LKTAVVRQKKNAHSAACAGSHRQGGMKMSEKAFISAILISIFFFATSGMVSGAELSFSGDVDIEGDVSITKADKGITYPNGTRQTGWYSRTVMVSPLGSPTENGTQLLDKMDGITASSANPWLLKLEPGTYDIGANTLTVKPYVHVEGSGTGITVIRGNPASTPQSLTGVISCGDGTELRRLTVENYGASGDSNAVYMENASNVSLIEITARATAVGNNAVAIYLNKSGTDLFRVNAQASSNGTFSAGIYSLSTGFSATLCTISASQPVGATGDSYGVHTDTAAQFHGCTIQAGGGGSYTYGILNGTSGYVSVVGGIVTGSNGSVWNHAIWSAGSLHCRGTELSSQGSDQSFGILNANDASSAFFEGGKGDPIRL